MTSEKLGTKKIVDREKLHYRRGTDDINFVIPELLDLDMYRIQHLANLEPEFPSVVLDCGAHIGIFSLLAATSFSKAIIHSFEPQPDNFELLTKNAAEYKNIVCHQEAVGLENERMKLYQFGSPEEGLTGRWSFISQNTTEQKYVEVECIDLDEFILNLNQPVFVLKLDLEGHEANIIEGISAAALHRVKILIVEEHTQPINQSKLDDIGFKLYFHPLGLSQHIVLINQYFWEQPTKTQFSSDLVHSQVSSMEEFIPLNPQIRKALAHFVDDRQNAWMELLDISEKTVKLEIDLRESNKKSILLERDRDRLWDEVQLWSQEATTKEKAFQEMKVDRDRLWEEVLMWSKEAHAKEKSYETLKTKHNILRDELANKEKAYEEMKEDRNRLWDEAKMTRNELDQIYASRSYRIFQRIRESTLGGMTIRWLQHLLARKMQNQAAIKSPSSPKIYELPDQSPNKLSESVPPPRSPSTQSGASEFTLQEREWLEKVIQTPQPLSVQHPEWLGIHHSAEQLFNSLFDLENNLDETRGMHYARLFIEAQPPAIVLQGYPLTYYYLIKALKKVKPQIPVYVIWHGSFMQAGEDLDWNGFLQITQLCRNGMVRKLGFVKKGMAETLAKTGLRTAFVMNYIRQIPNAASTPLAEGPHFGLWSIQPIWRKLPFAMLAALSTIQNAKVYCVGQDQRALDFASYFNINIQTSAFIPYKLVLKKMSEMNLNLYITMSETSGMVTLESLSVGTPCLFGPNTHYFEDQPYLLSRLMVNYPERSEVIAKYIEQALSEREQIIKTYIQYAPGYNALARKLLSEFLEMEIN